MKLTRKLIVTAALAALPLSALAQSTADFIDRNGDQQRRIEQGLRTGDLTVQEAAHLERQEAGVSRLQSRALSDGTLSNAERARIDSAQDRVGQNIARERNDNERGDPNSASSRRMQAEVQRNVNQQERIEQGVRSGQLTNREAGRLEHGQARSDGMLGRAGADGRIDRHEQRQIQGSDNRQSRQIYNERHDGQFRGGGDQRQGYGNHNGGQFRHGGDYRASGDFRRDGGFRGQPRGQQPRQYAQAGRHFGR
jgi:uncharacterized membrane protein YebE (DUF533 family)